MPLLIWWNSTSCRRSMKSVRPSSMVKYFLPPSSHCRDERRSESVYAIKTPCSWWNEVLTESEGNSQGLPGNVWSSACNTARGQSTARAAGSHESGTCCNTNTHRNNSDISFTWKHTGQRLYCVILNSGVFAPNKECKKEPQMCPSGSHTITQCVMLQSQSVSDCSMSVLKRQIEPWMSAES